MGTSCTQQNVKGTQPLASDEGVLVTRIDCTTAVSWLQFYQSGKNATGFLGGMARDGVIACGTGMGRKSLLRTIRVRQGKYFIGMVGQTSTLGILEADALSFTIEAGKLNYIGDLLVPLVDFESKGSQHVTTIDILASDGEDAARNAVASEYPGLVGTYPWVKKLAADPRR